MMMVFRDDYIAFDIFGYQLSQCHIYKYISNLYTSVLFTYINFSKILCLKCLPAS